MFMYGIGTYSIMLKFDGKVENGLNFSHKFQLHAKLF